MDELKTHIAAVTDDPSLPLDANLIESFDRSVTETLPESDRGDLLNLLSALIPSLRQDPKPVTSLIQTLIQPASVSFSNVLAIRPEIDLASGLASTNVDIGLTTLSLLGKACAKAGDAGIIAASQHVVAALIRLWLCTPDTEVSRQALWVLTGLLRIDIDISLGGDSHMGGYGVKRRGQGPMWRRLFQDKDVYGLFFSICSLTTTGQPDQLGKREKTIAQSRVLDFVLTYRNFEQVNTSQLPNVEALYGVKDGGLLEFVSIHMIDYKDDLLMHATLIDFFSHYLRGESPGLWPDLENDLYGSYDAILFLESKGLHSRTMSYYTEPDKHSSLDMTYLYPRSAEYVAAYTSCYPSHFLQRESLAPARLLERLSRVLSRWPSSHWGHGNPPTSDLHVLSSLPRVALLHHLSTSPLFDIPAKPANTDALNTLATVFRGPSLDAAADEQEYSNQVRQETAAARALYYYYLRSNPTFWAQITNTAEVVAMKENALAAINVMNAVIEANWTVLPSDTGEESETSYPLPTESDLENHFGQRGRPLAPTGAIAILTGSAQAQVIPYLLRPAQTFGKGDTQSAAYAVAVAKYDVIVNLDRKLKIAQTIPELEQYLSRWQPLVGEIRICVARGVWGGSSAVGGTVGTLER